MSLPSVRLPEVRIERKGIGIERVVWDPVGEDGPQFDLTGMRITRVERDVQHGELPIVRISVVARLVEVEQNTGSEPK